MNNIHTIVKNPFDVLLLVLVPSLEELRKKSPGLSFSDAMGLLETYAFLQQELSGHWVIDESGFAGKQTLGAHYTTIGQALWIDLASITPLEICCIRTHYQHVVDNKPDVSVQRSVAIFKFEQYPDNCPFKTFEIGAMNYEGRLAVTHTFVK